MVSTTDRLEDVGGHDHLKAWLREAQLSFSDKARAYGIEPVRATLFAGIPGTAKSLIAKAIGCELEPARRAARHGAPHGRPRGRERAPRPAR